MRVYGTYTGLSLAAALALVLSGCSGSPHATDEHYFLVATNIKVPYWQTALAGLNQARAEMRVKAEMVGPDTYDPKAEATEFRSALARNPTGILISAGDAAVMTPEIDAALSKGVPVLTIDSDAPDSKRLFFVGTDNYKAGTEGGKLTAKLLNNKGNVAVLTMPDQGNLKERLHGYKDVFDQHPDIKITQIIDMQGRPEVAFDKAKEVLDNKKEKVDAFVCLEAIACPEVSDVVSRENMGGKVVVVAMDTDQRTLEGIQKGLISATIAQKPFTMAYYGLKLLDDVHHHKPNPLVANWAQDSFSRFPTFVDTGASLIDKNNVATFIQQSQSSTTQ
jgi:ribose transport system substrate-binding protein